MIAFQLNLNFFLLPSKNQYEPHCIFCGDDYEDENPCQETTKIMYPEQMSNVYNQIKTIYAEPGAFIQAIHGQVCMYNKFQL